MARRASTIMTAAEKKDQLKTERETLKELRMALKDTKVNFMAAKKGLREATKTYNAFERLVTKAQTAVEKQSDRIAALKQ